VFSFGKIEPRSILLMLVDVGLLREFGRGDAEELPPLRYLSCEPVGLAEDRPVAPRLEGQARTSGRRSRVIAASHIGSPMADQTRTWPWVEPSTTTGTTPALCAPRPSPSTPRAVTWCCECCCECCCEPDLEKPSRGLVCEHCCECCCEKRCESISAPSRNGSVLLHPSRVHWHRHPAP